MISPTPQAIANFTLPPPGRILVLAPHPDDFDAIAVTLKYLHERGAEIHLAVLTGGASGVEDGYANAYSDATKNALRAAEQRASCALFGLAAAHVQFLELLADAKGNPRLDEGNYATMRGLLQLHHPQLVFMPHGNDSNVTHQRVYALFRQVVLEDGLEVLAVLNQDAKTIAMRKDLYTAFNESTAAWKASLLRCHQSQHQRNLNTRGHGFDERVLAVNRATARDMALSEEYAEAFELEHWPRMMP